MPARTAPLRRGAGALLAGLALMPQPGRAGAGQTFATEVACGKASGFDPATCRRAFAAARAEYEAKTRSYPSRFACYRAYGPCMPWPGGAAPVLHFRPQWMGVVVIGPPAGLTALPVIAPGHARLALVPRSLDEAVTAPSTVSRQVDAPEAGAAPESLCRQIEAVALKAHLPPDFLARLLWQESSFRADVVSPAGARGIAQFMPGTAEERGLDDPFDAPRAIETSAGLLGDLARRFGNLGLAAAAYNGGPARVSGWLKGQRLLAAETQEYVERITGRPVEDWAKQVRGEPPSVTQGPCRFAGTGAR